MFHLFFMFKEYIFYEPVIQTLWFYVNDGFPILLLRQMAQNFLLITANWKTFLEKKIVCHFSGDKENCLLLLFNYYNT